MKQLFCIHPNAKFDHKKPEGPDNRRNFWREVGTGFDNQDGSINVFLHAQPGVTFQLREKEEREPGQDG